MINRALATANFFLSSLAPLPSLRVESPAFRTLSSRFSKIKISFTEGTMKSVRLALLCAVILLSALSASSIQLAQEDAIAQKARKIHFSSVVLDTHIDVTPNLQREGWKFAEEHTTGAVDLPRMKK